MFGPEKIMPEIAFLLMNQDRPWQGHEDCRNNRQPPPCYNQGCFFMPYQPGHQYENGHGKRQKALGQKGEPEKNTRTDGIQGISSLPVNATRHYECHNARGQEQGKQVIEYIQRTHKIDQQVTQIDQSRKRPAASAPGKRTANVFSPKICMEMAFAQ